MSESAKENDDRGPADTGDEMERKLARTIAWGLPATAVIAAIVVGALFGVGPAILVLASGALIGVIGLLWASLRTLGGDAPLPEGLAEAFATREKASDGAEKKKRVLRALKDLEHEHSVGKIDDDDYAQISAKYRDQAKTILREQDLQIEPLRVKAEALVRAHMQKKGIAAPSSEKGRPSPAEPVASGAARRPCAKCQTSNEPDAAFCKKCGGPLDAGEAPAAEATDATG